MGFVENQTDNQIITYGVDPVTLRGAERAEYIRDQVLALTEELHEILRENHWKPWHKNRPHYGEISSSYEEMRPEYINDILAAEFADCLCFLGNLARAHGLTTADLERAHEKKLWQNAERHADNAVES